MSNFISFMSDNYVWFLVITIFLILSLIGYLYDIKNNTIDINKNTFEEEVSEEISEEINIQSDKSLNDMVNNTSTTDSQENIQNENSNINN